MNTEKKITLWNQYNSQINTIESRLTISATLVSIAFTILSSALGDANVIYSIPALSVVFLYYMAYQQRIVEILRGYLLFIEEELLKEIEYNGFSWNTFGVSKCYNVPYFRAQLFAGPMFVIIMGLSYVYSFYKMFSNGECLSLVIPYLVISLFFCISFALDLLDNNCIAMTVKESLTEDKIKEKPKLKGKRIRNILAFWSRR